VSVLRPLVIVLALAVLAALSLAPASAVAHPGHGAGHRDPGRAILAVTSDAMLNPTPVTAIAPAVTDRGRGRIVEAERARGAVDRLPLRMVEVGHAGIGCREGCCAGSCCAAGPCATALPAAEGPAATAPAAPSGVRQAERAAPRSLAREAGLRPPRRGA
jgi:hypothetical protein